MGSGAALVRVGDLAGGVRVGASRHVRLLGVGSLLIQSQRNQDPVHTVRYGAAAAGAVCGART